MCLPCGRDVHAYIIYAGLQSYVHVGTALVNMYAKCGSIRDARQAFDKMSRNVISWHIMIVGYAQHIHCKETFDLFHQMQQVGIKPNQITYMSLLNACAFPTYLEHGKEVHAHIIEVELQFNVHVGNALTNMYAKCGSIKDAQLVFDEMGKRDVISWSAMIAGFALHSHSEEALEILHQMQLIGVKPDQITYLSILNACVSPAALECGKELHNQIIDPGYESDVCVSNALVNMYSKFGSIRDARVVFDKMIT